MAGQSNLDSALENNSRNGPSATLGMGAKIGIRSISGKCSRDGFRANYRCGSKKGL